MIKRREEWHKGEKESRRKVKERGEGRKNIK